MTKRFILICALALVFMITGTPSDTYSQTEGFNEKTPIENIADASVKFLESYIRYSKEAPDKSIPAELLCSAKCYIVIPNIEMVQSRGDFTGSGIMQCTEPRSGQLTEPLFYNINNVKTFYEEGGSLIILVTDTDGMKSVLGNDVHVNSNIAAAGTLGKQSGRSLKPFIAYAMPKEEAFKGYDLSGSVITYASMDTFNAYEETVVPVEIFVYPEDVPPFLRGFTSKLEELIKDCT